MLFDALADPTDAVALRFGDRTLTYRQLRGAATAVAERVDGCERVATWAVNEPEVAVAVIGALLAGVPITPINPKAGSSELATHPQGQRARARAHAARRRAAGGEPGRSGSRGAREQ